MQAAIKLRRREKSIKKPTQKYVVSQQNIQGSINMYKFY